MKKSQKHDANLQKNSTLYFQIGLIVCLLAAYGLLEMRFETAISTDNDFVADLIDNVEAPVEKFKIYVEPAAEVKPEVVKKVVLTKDPIIVDDDTKILVDLDILTEEDDTTSEKQINPGDMDDIVEPIEESVVDFVTIEQVPIYPGCENKKTNPARRKCMTEKLTKLIQRRFKTGLADDLGLSGIQNIQTQFTIDKTGNIIDIKTRAPHPKLESEAKRVINSIPEMEPGKQRDKPVGVRYTLPIKFQVEN
ncbi:MAG: energy transducer TonB [Algibacter sp.]